MLGSLNFDQEFHLDLLNVFVVKIVLLESLQFIICIVLQSFHDLDLKMTKMKRFLLQREQGQSDTWVQS